VTTGQAKKMMESFKDGYNASGIYFLEMRIMFPMPSSIWSFVYRLLMSIIGFSTFWFEYY
jgi:hypothetical protein